MTIDPETLMAYADGELDAVTAKRVERAMAQDPALAAKVDQHRALAASLRQAFAPVAQADVPEGVAAMLRTSAQVVPITPPARWRSMARERGLWAGAVAASLVAGLLIAPLLHDGSDLTIEGGRMLARGGIAHALDTQLAATQPRDAPILIGVTFRDKGRRLCRSFEQGGTGGIACADGPAWEIERLYGGIAGQQSDYRQAGSGAAALMAEAQAMMAGDPMDAAAEAAAIGERRP